MAKVRCFLERSNIWAHKSEPAIDLSSGFLTSICADEFKRSLEAYSQTKCICIRKIKIRHLLTSLHQHGDLAAFR